MTTTPRLWKAFRSIRTVQVALISAQLAPVSALAHGDSHAPDPNLHVDPSLEECEVHFSPELSQPAFRRFTREFGSASAYKQMAPPDTLRPWDAAVGIEYTTFWVDDKSDAWNDTFTHPDDTHELGSNQGFPKLKLRVGVADGTDVGAFFTMNPLANYGWIGVEAKHALWRQGGGMPVTVAMRGAYTKTLFVDDMDMHALSGGVSLGRTFWKTLTPYVGGGSDLVLARETAKTVDLDDELVLAPHALAGVEVAFWHLALGLEAQYAAIPSIQAQIAAVF